MRESLEKKRLFHAQGVGKIHEEPDRVLIQGEVKGPNDQYHHQVWIPVIVEEVKALLPNRASRDNKVPVGFPIEED